MRPSGTQVVPLILLSIALLSWLPPGSEAPPEPVFAVAEARLGEGWVEERDGLRILHLQGTPYEMGYQHGVLLREEIRARFGSYLLGRLIPESQASHLLLLRHAREVETYLASELRQEMAGLADGAGMSYSQVLLLNTYGDVAFHPWPRPSVQELLLALSPTFLPHYSLPGRLSTLGEDVADDCSLNAANAVAGGTFAVFGWATSDGALLHAAGLTSPVSLADILLVVYRPTAGNAFVAVAQPGMVGFEMGVNEARLSVTAVPSPSQDASLEGVPLPFVLREVLQHARDIRAAERTLASTRRTTGHNVLIGDGRRPDAHLVEFSTRLFAVFQSENDLLVRTAHYLDSDLAETQRSLSGWEGDTSRGHLDELLRAIQPIYGEIGPSEAAMLLRQGRTAPQASGSDQEEGAIVGVLMSVDDVDIRLVTEAGGVVDLGPGVRLDEEL